MRGLKSDLVLLDEAKDFAPKGESPLLRVVKDLMYFDLLKEANRQLYMGSLLPERRVEPDEEL